MRAIQPVSSDAAARKKAIAPPDEFFGTQVEINYATTQKVVIINVVHYVPNIMPFAKFASTTENSMDGNDDQKARIWGTLCHLSCLVCIVPLTILGFAGIPFLFLLPTTSFLGPLLIWRLKKNQHPFIDVQGKEALNFQISITLYTIALALVFFLGAFLISTIALMATTDKERIEAILTVASLGVIPMTIVVPIIGIVNTVSVIIAALKVAKGQSYRYPYKIQLVK